MDWLNTTTYLGVTMP